MQRGNGAHRQTFVVLFQKPAFRVNGDFPWRYDVGYVMPSRHRSLHHDTP